MSKKLFISIMPLLATAAFVVMPAAAQAATPHWYSNGKVIPAGEQVPTLSWGTLTLTNSVTEESVSCQNAALGYNENPSGGGPGVGETDSFATANCVALLKGKPTECTPQNGLEAVVTAEYLPWGAELENGTFGTKSIIRNRTKPFPASTPGFSSHLAFLSTEGAQVTVHCEFRGEQEEVKGLIQEKCPTGIPAGSGSWLGEPEVPGTSSATKYNSGTRTDETNPADGFEALDVEKTLGETGACSGAGLTLEKEEVERRPSAPGDPASYNVPGAAVVTCEGENAPRLTQGAVAAKPSEVLFDQNGEVNGSKTTGRLSCQPEGEGITTGSLKSLGYNELEIISAKSP